MQHSETVELSKILRLCGEKKKSWITMSLNDLSKSVVWGHSRYISLDYYYCKDIDKWVTAQYSLKTQCNRNGIAKQRKYQFAFPSGFKDGNTLNSQWEKRKPVVSVQSYEQLDFTFITTLIFVNQIVITCPIFQNLTVKVTAVSKMVLFNQFIHEKNVGWFPPPPPSFATYNMVYISRWLNHNPLLNKLMYRYV